MGNKYLEKIASEIEQLEKEAGAVASILEGAGRLAGRAGAGLKNMKSGLGGAASGYRLDREYGTADKALGNLAKNRSVQVAGGIAAGGALAAGGIVSALRGNKNEQ